MLSHCGGIFLFEEATNYQLLPIIRSSFYRYFENKFNIYFTNKIFYFFNHLLNLEM